MRIKSYFASTVEAALSEARRELGPEAVLVESRHSAPESRKLGAYEVVCAVVSAGQPVPDSAGRPPGRVPLETEHLGHLSENLTAFFQRLEGLTRSLDKIESSALRIGASHQTNRMIDRLEAAEIDMRLFATILGQANQHVDDSPEDSLRQAVAAQIPVDSTLGAAGAHRKIVAVAGPPGAGKTSTLVKLAARYGVGARKPSLILSVDTQRVGASEPLRAYASILGAGFQAVETPTALAQALQEHHGKEWIWIDTPGLSRREIEEAGDLIRVLSSEPDIDTHLVLPASMRASEISRTVDQFLCVRPSKLLFTRVDETSVHGAILNESVRSGLPLSFLSDGPQIPEDLTEASADAVAALILQQRHDTPPVTDRVTHRAARAASAAA